MHRIGAPAKSVHEFWMDEGVSLIFAYFLIMAPQTIHLIGFPGGYRATGWMGFYG